MEETGAGDRGMKNSAPAPVAASASSASDRTSCLKKSEPAPVSAPLDGRSWHRGRSRGRRRSQRTEEIGASASGVKKLAPGPCLDDVGEKRRICNKWFVGTGLT